MDMELILDRAGRIPSGPRWRAAPRALLHGLGLTALIACAGCGDSPSLRRDGQLLDAIEAGGSADERQTEILGLLANRVIEQEARIDALEAASGTETRQGGDGTAPSRSDDGPARAAGDAQNASLDTPGDGE